MAISCAESCADKSSPKNSCSGTQRHTADEGACTSCRVSIFAQDSRATRISSNNLSLRFNLESLALASPIAGYCLSTAAGTVFVSELGGGYNNTARSSASPSLGAGVSVLESERAPGSLTSLLHDTVEILEHEGDFIHRHGGRKAVSRRLYGISFGGT